MLREKILNGYHMPEEDTETGKLEIFYENLFPNDRIKAAEVIGKLVA